MDLFSHTCKSIRVTSETSICRQYLVWDDIRVLYVLERIPPGIISAPVCLESALSGMWYGFRVLNSKKGRLPGMILGSFVIRKYKLESLNLYLSGECLRMCF